jgi:hypothetical protein
VPADRNATPDCRLQAPLLASLLLSAEAMPAVSSIWAHAEPSRFAGCCETHKCLAVCTSTRNGRSLPVVLRDMLDPPAQTRELRTADGAPAKPI